MKLKLSREFKIGFFGILMIAALYWGVNFLKGTDLFTSSVHYYAAYDQVNGLQPSAAVVIKGYKVGTISDISYDPQRSNNVVVEFAIKSKFKIPKDTKARIFSDGIMGGKSIELELAVRTHICTKATRCSRKSTKIFWKWPEASSSFSSSGPTT